MDKVDLTLRRLCWLYIFLLIFEGALRKWVLPQFSNILLLARDPVVLTAYAYALIKSRFPWNRYVVSVMVIAYLSLISTFLVGHANPFVTAFGLRANFLHLPFAFIMGRVFYRSDVIKLGNFWLWGTLGMTALIGLQFYSPQSAWINSGVGGADSSAGFSGAGDRYRPPGTFSFIVGVVSFYTLSAAFLISAVTQHRYYKKSLIVLSSIAIAIAIPVSISRGLILSVGLTFIVGMLAATSTRRPFLRFFQITFFSLVAFFVASQFEIFNEATDAFTERWEAASSSSDGGVKEAIFMRVIREFTDPFFNNQGITLFGAGLGAGTQVGTQLLTGERNFNLGEGEWFRLIGEMGIVLGFFFILWRVLLAIKLARLCVHSFLKGNGMALILLSTTAFNLMVGQFGQTTINGFVIVGLGLTIAAMRIKESSSPKSLEN